MPTRNRKLMSRPARTADTADRLVRAAADEFRRHGFAGTDTNKIARRAGFAPQTFYRRFRNKTEAFLAVYRAWEEEERRVLGGLIAEKAAVSRLVDAIVEHHRAYLVFRRSLRQLALEDADVRKTRAETRRRQIEQIKIWIGPAAPPDAELAVLLLQLERLSDAAAEQEFSDLGFEESVPRKAIADLLSRLRGKAARS
jgi:AcrR family transcriptional regulator